MIFSMRMSTVLPVISLIASICAGQQICDCSSCTQSVLDTDACNGNVCHKCGDRIKWLMSGEGGSLTEYNACVKIAVEEFPGTCGPCNPDSCDPTPTQSSVVPTSSPKPQMCGVESCTQSVLDAEACGNQCHKCGDRIKFLITNGSLEIDACLQVGTEFPHICGPCIPEGLTNAPTPSIPSPDNSTLVWSDEFSVDGKPDPEKWGYDIGGGGWGNGELQYYTDRLNNAFVLDGVLNVRAVREDYGERQYTSARLVSKNRGDFKYGRFQFRARLKQCVARGTWPALWMLPTDWVYGGWPDSGEIDVMEHVGYDTGRVHGTVHTRAFNHGINTQVGDSILTSVEKWHVYDIIWDEEKIDFIIDGVKYHEFINRNKSYKEWPFDEKFHLIMNVAVGGAWGGAQGVDSNAFEGNGQIMEVDWVRVYSESATSSPVKSPTKSPSKSPTNPCTQNEDDKFLFKGTVGLDARKKTCDWLSNKSKKKVKDICTKKTQFSGNLKPAEIICEETCESCDVCFENSTGKSIFFFKFARNGNPEYRNCKWLQKSNKAEKYCGKRESNEGRGPPGEVCPQTCSDVTSCPSN